jgi:hypothetical protein
LVVTTWVFVATAQKVGGKLYSPRDILDLRFKDRFWGLNETTPNRKLLKKGDQVVFYLGVPIKSFTASAVLASDQFQLDPSQKQKYSHNLEYFTADYGVLLDDFRIWEKSVAVDHISNDLQGRLPAQAGEGNVACDRLLTSASTGPANSCVVGFPPRFARRRPVTCGVG